MVFEDINYENLISGKLEKEFPEFYALKNVVENNPWHDNETTFAHTLAVLKELQKIIISINDHNRQSELNTIVETHTKKELLYLATIMHDLGKPDTIIHDNEYTYFPKHELISLKIAEKILDKIKLEHIEKDFVLGIIKNHSEVHKITSIENTEIDKQYKQLQFSGKEYFEELIFLVWADTSSGILQKTEPDNFHFRINYYKKVLGLI